MTPERMQAIREAFGPGTMVYAMTVPQIERETEHLTERQWVGLKLEAESWAIPAAWVMKIRRRLCEAGIKGGVWKLLK